MKLLVIADRPPIDDSKIVAEQNNVDLVVTLGDLDGASLAALKGITNIPKIGVYGNHCSGKYFGDVGITNMHMMTWEYKGVKFGGFQGSLRYKKDPQAIMYTQEEAEHLFTHFPYVDVLLTHSPPYGIHDEPNDPTHEGLIAIRNYIDKYHPKFVLHGHVYVSPDIKRTQYNGTEIIFVYRQHVVEIAV
jgi:Icc-related predicted phosphoesterase